MFNMERGLLENPIHRYAIGGRTEGLKYTSDGSLDLLVQFDAPASPQVQLASGTRKRLLAPSSGCNSI
jgi:hypothetical protein